MPKLDSTSAQPLYKQLKRFVLEQISSGVWAEGQKIPTELALAEEFQVSRITVRTALAELVEEGRLTRQQGKGTFVGKCTVQENVLEHRSFSAVCRENAMQPGSRVLAVAVQPAQEADVSLLGVLPDSEVLYLRRVLLADGRPVVVEDNYFPERFRGMLQEDLNNVSLYGLLERRYGLRGLCPRKTIEVGTLTAEEAQLLAAQPDTPVLIVHEVVYDDHGAPVHRTRQVVHGGKFKYVIL